MSEKEYEIPGYSSRMSSQLYRLQQDGYMCDAVIATNSGIINVHKLVLMASNSPVLVESVKKTEKTGGSICLIDIAADITDVKHFVRALYTGKMHLVPDCMNRLIHISQILKMEEEIKFLEKIKMEFENSSLINISKEIDLTESGDAGQITTQTDSDKNSLEMEDLTKDSTSEKEDSLSADNVDIKVEVPAYGSGVDIEMQIPGFEYSAEAPSTGIKRERNGDSYQEQGDGDMLESKRQRISCVTTVTDLTQEIDESLPDTESESIIKKIHGSTTERLLEVELEAFTRDGKSKSSLPKCKECSFTTKWRHSLTRHKRIHDNTHFRCEMCPSKYLSKSTLKEHVKLKHGDGLVCNHCSKVFGSREGLRLHLIALKGEYKFQCEVCNKVFTNRTHYNGHLNLHRNYRPFECTNCGKAFFPKGSMKKHWDSCGKGTLYLCDLCGIKFASSDSLRNHNLGKHSSKKIICDTCGKTYNWAASYYRHACFRALKSN